MPKHPVDVQVGSRVRELRIRAGMSQTNLGDSMGVSFQQVQKYELGANRMGASRLMQVCDAVGCTLEELFVGIDGPDAVAGCSPLDKDAAKVARDYAAIPDEKIRETLRKVIRELSVSEA